MAEQQTPASVVERLRARKAPPHSTLPDSWRDPLCQEAATLIERLSAEREGRWYAAEDIDRMVRDIDVAMNGGGAAKQAKLCDIYSQIIALTQGESRQSGWRDIATHDGSESPHVLLCEDGYVFEGRLTEDGWYARNNDATDHWGGECFPKLWMPLPAAPTPADGGGE